MKFCINYWRISSNLRKVFQAFSKILLEHHKILRLKCLLREFGGLYSDRLIFFSFKKQI